MAGKAGMTSTKPRQIAETYAFTGVNVLDGRSEAGRALAERRSGLLRQLGRTPTIAEEMLVDRAACLDGLCGQFEARLRARKPIIVPHYVTSVHALTNVLRRLGIRPSVRPVSMTEAFLETPEVVHD